MSLNLGVIGNCQIAALIDTGGRIVWACFPRLDGDPVFSRLIDETDRGYFAIELQDLVAVRQYYERNTAVLCTELDDRQGGSVRITDFCPRFRQFGRHFRPAMIIRRLEILSGTPVVRVKIRPTTAYGSEKLTISHGSNHIRFVSPDWVTRISTDAPLTYVLHEQPMVLDGGATFIIGPDESIKEALPEMGRRFLDLTREYWHDWARSLSIPLDWQQEVIRSAITLKLCSYEDTGAVIAAITMSIPEAPDSERNWDYRYCWLRDAYFMVHALNRLGTTRTMEGFLHYIINLVVGAAQHELQPLYGIGGETRIDEKSVNTLTGYRGMGPVRLGNAAYTQSQHDIYGAVVLAATQAFFDERLERPGNETLFRRLEILGSQAATLYDKPDAGIWEYRGHKRVHTYSAVMCWAACDRLSRIARRLRLESDATRWRKQAVCMHARICREAWNEDRGAFVDSFGGESMDASLLLLHDVGFLPADDPRFIGTVNAIEQNLRQGDHIFRYDGADDFGLPRTAFNICTFWYIDALHAIGRRDEARQLFENMLTHRTDLGLLSEDLDIKTGELWGNFPQAYSMVGLINCALRLSREWQEAF
ncbi:MAG: glycoside hydrolase family 15 protein [Nitrococcus sp.]|nr:glycoside hydrolase family 15 protein [Nitrococcus sp.]